jgi:O-antigen ligase
MYIGIALAIGLVGVLVLSLFVDASSRLRGRVFPIVFVLIGMAIAVSSLLSGRNLSHGDLIVSMGWVEPAATRWFLRGTTLLVLSASVAAFVSYVLDRKSTRPGGAIVLAAFVVFFLTNSVLNAIFGTKPDFAHSAVYPLVVMAGAYSVREFDVERSVLYAKVTLLILLVISCIAAVAVPDIALQRPYKGWIPGLDVRLWGVGSNANSIGPLALLYLLTATHQPFKRRWIHWCGGALGVVVLVLAQSKTAFGAAVIALAVLYGYRMWARLGEAYNKGSTSVPLVGTATVLLVCACAALLAAIFVDPGLIVDRFLESRAGDQLLTLTGRNVLWAIALEEWSRNPLFGYGPSMWDPEYRRSIGLFFAFSAHNQFMQSLGAAGAMGLIGLLIYLCALAVYALRAANASRGLSLALLVVVLLRCLSEAPLSTNTLFNGDLLTHLLLFSVALGFGSKDRMERSTVNVRSQPAIRHA